MNKLTAIIGILAISSSVFAGECLSKESKSQRQLIENSTQIDQATKEYLLSQEARATFSEIMACIAANQTISKAEAEIAINKLRKSENQRIQELTHTSIYMENALNDSSLSDFMRIRYQKELKEIPDQIQKEKDRIQSLLQIIERNTK